MKQTIIVTIVLTLASALAISAQAQGRHDDKPHGMTKPAESASEAVSVPSAGGRHDDRPHGVVRATGTGVVKGIDAAGKKITLEHEAVKKFRLKASTHDFSVKDSQPLGALNEGDRVKFVLEKSGKNFVVVQIDKSEK